MQRDFRRRRTRFGRWIAAFGVPRLRVSLQARGEPITTSAPYNWLAGRHAPRPRTAMLLVQLSRGRITLDDIHAHVVRAGQIRDRSAVVENN